MKKRDDCPLTNMQILAYIVGTGLLVLMPYWASLLS